MMNNVTKQYQTPDKLTTRISIHEKYSTNKQPFSDWIVSHYEIEPGFRILEIGCGTGDMWKGKLSLLDDGARLTLTDFSEGMLEAARQTLSGHKSVDFKRVDIQSIPYEDSSFDMVIANMMLYHVPDLHKGLSEVRRVLKQGGKFYCATYGEHGIMEFINNTLKEYNIFGSIDKKFTLQNGGESLSCYFSFVEKLTREDSLAVTDVTDFVEYVMSLSSLTGLEGTDAQMLLHAFEQKCIDGILYIPKEYGMFICR